jgi:hypothetical protein
MIRMKQYKQNAMKAGWYTGVYITSIVVLIAVIEKIK